MKYRIIKDGSNSYIKILPSVFFRTPGTEISSDQTKLTIGERLKLLRNVKDVNNVINVLKPPATNPPANPLPTPSVPPKVIYITPNIYKNLDLQRPEILAETNINSVSEASGYILKSQIHQKCLPSQRVLMTEHITGIPVSIPFKYRFDSFPGRDQWSANFNLGYALGYKYRLGKNPYNDNFIRTIVAIGAGTQNYFNVNSPNAYTSSTIKTTTTTTTLPTINPDGSTTSIKTEVINENRSDSNTQQFSYSWALGATIELGSRFNFGLFYGRDYMTGSHRDWLYHGRPWLGFGIGINFGTPKTPSSK